MRKREAFKSFVWVAVACWLASVVNGIAGHYEAAALNVIAALLAVMIVQREEDRC